MSTSHRSKGGFAVVDPLRQRHAGAAGRDDADRIVAGRHPVAGKLRRLAEIVAVVGGKTLRAVEEGVDAGRRQHRHAVDAHFEDRLEMVHVLGQLVEAEILADAVHAPGLGHRLEGAEHHLAGVLLVVGAFVRHAQHRQPGEAGDRLGDEIEMLAGVQRDGDAVLRAELARPHAGAVDDDVGFDHAAARSPCCPGDAGDAAVLRVDLGHLHVLDDRRAALARALGQRHGDVGRVALAVERQMHGADHVRDVEMRIHLLDFVGRNLAHVDVEGARQRGLPVDLVLALLGQRHGDRADLAHAGGDAGLGLELDVEVGRIFREPRHVLRAAQLADQPGGMPCRARGQLLALQEHDVGPAELGQMIGDRAAGDAAADDDGARLGRQVVLLSCGLLGVGGGEAAQAVGGLPQHRLPAGRG